jgi:hypothetical protein
VRIPKRLPPTSAPRPASGPILELGQLRPKVSNAVLDPIGTSDTPLPLRDVADQAAFKGRVEQHEEMLSWIGVFEALIVELPKQRRGIGHNLQPITEEEVEATTQAVAVLKAQPVAPKAPDEARAAGSTLQKIVGRLGTYLDTFLLEASKSGGKEVGKQLARAPYWLALWYTLKNIVQSVAGWLP